MLSNKLFFQLFLSILTIALYSNLSAQDGCTAIQIDRSMLESDYQRLGEIKAGAHSFSNRCTRPQVIRDLQSEACRIGADFFVITDEKAPGLWRSCFTIEADAYRSQTVGTESLSDTDLGNLARSGNIEAQHELGVRFLNENETQPNLVEAYAWFNLAASQNLSHSIAERDRLETLLSPEKLAEAQDRSLEIWLNYYQIGAHRGAYP